MAGTNEEQDEQQKTIGAVDTLFDITEFLAENGPAGVTEVANATGRSKSTIHGHLLTLERRRYVVKTDSGYRIGHRFLTIGGAVIPRSGLYHIAKPELEGLADETGESVQLGVEEHGIGYYLHQSRGKNAVRTDSVVGTERHLHSTSFGKVILAYLPDERVDEIIDRHGLPKHTANTITDRDELLSELAAIRERGYAFDDSEQIDGIRCVAVPIRTDDGAIRGAISLSGPRKRMRAERFREEIPDLLSDAARIIEINLSNS